MPDAASDLADFDRQVVDLGNLFRRDPSSPTIPALAAGILDGQRGKLIYSDHPGSGRGWRHFYAEHRGVAWGRIDQLRCLDPRQKKALRNLLDAMAGVGCERCEPDWLPDELPSEKKERLNQLRVALGDYGRLRGLSIAEGDKPRLNPRKENILEALLNKAAFDRENSATRQTIVESINRKHKPSSYRRAFDGLREVGYTAGEPGAEGGIWLTPPGRERAEELRRRDATPEE